MRQFYKVLSFIITLIIILGVCGCRSHNSGRGDSSFSISDFDFDVGSGGNSEKRNGDKELPDYQNDVDGDSKGNSTSIRKDNAENEASPGGASAKAANKNNTASKSASGAHKSGSNSGGKPKGGNEASDVTDNDYTEVFVPMKIPTREKAYRLSNTYEKIKSGQNVKVVFYGGSVTGGTGASDENKTSYAALTADYFKSLSSKIQTYNLSVGGTGTYLGAARFVHNVVSLDPDLVFIEFAINDVYSGIKPDRSKENLEYMVNRLYDENPEADIVILLTTNTSTYGEQFSSYKAHREVADYYNIPIVDLGGEMYNKTKGGFDGFKDSVHPNDKGHKLYSDILIGALKELFVDKPVAPHNMPSVKLCKSGYTTIKNIVAPDIPKDKKWSCYSWFNNYVYEKEGCPLRTNKNLKEIYPKYLAPDDVGCTLKYTFTGNSFGIIGTLKTEAELRFVVDGKTANTIVGTSNVAMIEYPVFNNLANGSHTVEVTVKGTPYIAIASFVIGK